MSAAQGDFSTTEHDWHSQNYVEWWIARDAGGDAERRQRIREMLAQSGFGPQAAITVLDVGGGYGVVTEEVVTAFPQARACLQDYSEPMLAAARERLAQHGSASASSRLICAIRHGPARSAGRSISPSRRSRSTICAICRRSPPAIAGSLR